MTSPRRRIPIGDYGLIGDTRTAALVAPDGSIDWLCLPRFDSPPVFGSLVGGADAGHFLIGPDEPATLTTRRYRGDTATLETGWAVDGGRLMLADSMVGEVNGSLLPELLLVRRIASHGRPTRVRVEISPRFGYQRRPARRVHRQNGFLLIDYGDIAISITAGTEDRLEPDHPNVIEIRPNQPITVVMSASHRGPVCLVPSQVAASEAERDERLWQQWADSLGTGPLHRHAMVRSFITLQLLTYSPSGAPIAAPTTSLPEDVGGNRNWDYRYAWPRDASMGIAAFLRAGKDREARGFHAWLLHASRLARPHLPALFTLDGRPAPRERELEGWPGYADSRPVRVGNGARAQHQLDGYGWVLDAAWQLTRTGHRLDSETWRTMRAFADHVTRNWMLPDAGIWERRDPPRHHVHSKLMAWVALDRAIRIAEQRGEPPRRLKEWRAATGMLAEEIARRAFNPQIGCYTAVYESTDLDGALFLLPWTGFEPDDSPRVSSTIDIVRRELDAGGPLVYRYRDHDGLTGDEGAFLPCSFWLVHALARTGRRSQAETLFEELLDLGTDLGLYAEEMDPGTHDHLGNYPQALTHSALLQAASALEDPSAQPIG
jgi:GH15 family glucan-1,4-alpha-glucosidase